MENFDSNAVTRYDLGQRDAQTFCLNCEALLDVVAFRGWCLRCHVESIEAAD